MKAPLYKIRALLITDTEAKETEWVTSKDEFARAWYTICYFIGFFIGFLITAIVIAILEVTK